MARIEELIARGTRELAVLGKDEALASTERLLQALLGIDRSGLYLNPRGEIKADQTAQFETWIKRRKSREPLAYILGEAYFWNETLAVGPGCLIPRPETEILVETALTKLDLDAEERIRLMDVGSGSGAISIALLRSWPHAQATLVDVSGEALQYAKENLLKYRLLHRSFLVRSDLFEKIRENGGGWNLMISNPPYVTSGDLEKLDPEVRQEPREALDGGPDGLKFYRALIQEAPRFLAREGWLILEMGQGQAKAVSEIAEERNHYQAVEIFKDHSGIDRVIVMQVQSCG